MRLANKVAVVTGAAGGIGSAICLRLLMEGCSVVAADTGTADKPLAELGSKLTEYDAALTLVVANVATNVDNARLVDAARMPASPSAASIFS